MTSHTKQTEKTHAKVIKTVGELVDCLVKNDTPPIIGELALVLLAGTSAGSEMRPLTDVLIPTLKLGWRNAVEQGGKE